MLQQLAIALLFLFLTSPSSGFAQDIEQDPAATEAGANVDSSAAEQEIESLYDKEEKKSERKSKARKEEVAPTKEVQTLSDLANLAPFEDVAVIQRRFLPKTNRFELSGSAFSNLNNPFFTNVGAAFRAAYYLREKYAIEGLVTFASTAAREVTQDLESNRSITTDNVVTSKGFAGLAFKWNPIYGKITWLNKSIVPFDLNFNLGFGVTQTTDEQNEPTIHFGTSQVFAQSKSVAFRWDLMWNMYNTATRNSAGVQENLTQNDLFLGIGMSFYFPEASYR